MLTSQQKEPRDQLSLRIASSTKKRIEALAQATRRSKSFVVEEAINQYLELNEWQIESIERGLEDVKAGRVISHEDMLKEWEGDSEGDLD
ncbi:MAG: ribbon-helix-helix protein, CopG family [Chlorobiales bacterium]|nr:ribbon-helix-helix protein, CopG family [Chlorobiales bacterium]